MNNKKGCRAASKTFNADERTGIMKCMQCYFTLYVFKCFLFFFLSVTGYLPFLCPPAKDLSTSQVFGTPKEHSNSALRSLQQHKRLSQTAVIYSSPQSRLNFTEAVIAL